MMMFGWVHCALCPWSEPPDPNCTAEAMLVLHWMETHRDEYVAIPEVAGLLP